MKRSACVMLLCALMCTGCGRDDKLTIEESSVIAEASDDLARELGCSDRTAESIKRQILSCEEIDDILSIEVFDDGRHLKVESTSGTFYVVLEQGFWVSSIWTDGFEDGERIYFAME